MLRRISLTAAATVAALAGMASAQVPNVILNASPTSSSSPAVLSTDGNTMYGSATKRTFGVSGGLGTITQSPITLTGLVSPEQVLASGDGSILATVAQPGLPLPANYPAPSALTFSQSNTTVWYSTDAGTSWTRMPLFPTQAHCGGSMMSLYDMSTDGRYMAGQGYVRVTYMTGTPPAPAASNCTVHGWVYDRVTNTLSDLSDTFGGPTGQQNDTGRATFIVRSMSDDGAVVVGSAQGLGGETPVVWDRNGSGVYVPTRLTSSINIGGAREGRVSRDGSTIIGTSFDFSPSTGVKWTKGGGTWTATPIPANLAQVATNSNRPTSWLTYMPTGQQVTPTAISQDGSVIVGTISYAGGSSSSAFMWTAATGTVDLFDYILSTAGDNTGVLIYNPTMPAPTVVKKDPAGQIVIFVTGSPISGTASAVVKFQSSALCYPPTFLSTAGTSPTISACSASPSLAPGAASGTGPFSYMWFKDSNPVTLGPTIWGSNVTMSNPPTLSLSNAQGPDAGAYNCRAIGPVSGPCLPAGFTTDSQTFNLTTMTPIQYTTDSSQSGDTCVSAVDLSNPVTVVSSPSNINFPALTVASLPRTMTSWNSCAAVTNNIIGASCVGSSNGDVWFKWTPDADVTVRLSTCDVVGVPSGAQTVSDTLISVYTAGPGTLPNGADCTGTEIACNDSTVAAFCTTTARGGIDQLALTGGQTYYIRVAVKSPFAPATNVTNYAGLTITNMASQVIPANDNCAGAIALTPSTNTAFSTLNATTELSSVSCNPANGSGKDVWFKFTPASSGEYRLSLCSGAAAGTTPPLTNPTTSWDSIVTMFDGCNGNEVACNDNQGSLEPLAVSCSNSSISRISRVTLNSGFTYVIRVAGINGAIGAMTQATTAGSINIFPAPARPANNDCLNATAVNTAGAAPWTVTGVDTTEASLDGANTCGPSITSTPDRYRDVWFSFTPPSTPATGWRIQFCGQTWGDTGLSVHTACPGDASNEVAGGCNNNVGNNASALPSACGTNNNSRIDSVALTAGVTYYIRAVTNTFSTSGTTTSTLTIAPAPTGPVNDFCAASSTAVVGSNNYDLTEATTETGGGSAGCVGTGQRSGYDVWYTFNPTCTGSYSFLACGSFTAPNNINPVLALYANCGDALATTPTFLACSENTSTTPFPTLMATMCASTVTQNTALILNQDLTAGTPVTIRMSVQDFASNTGSFRPTNPAGTFSIVQNVLCCRGVICTQTTSNSQAACTAPAGVGAVKTTCGSVCTGNTFQGCCFADFNHDGVQSIDDLFLYFNAYFIGSPFANFGGNGTDTPTIDDLFLYINAYFGTCS